MTNRFYINSLAGLGLIFTFLACTHSPQKTDSRHPSSEKAATLDAEEVQKYKDAAIAKDSKRLRSLLDGEYRAQILVTAFDARISQAKDVNKMDDLLKSQLYCKIINLRYLHEKNEAKLVALAKQAYTSGAETKKWMFEQISQFAKENPAKEAGTIQALRKMVAEEKFICDARDCVVDQVRSLRGLSLNPLDNAAFSKFMKSHQKTIALRAELTNKDLKPGTCFDSEKRQPNQVTGYDWKNRTWVGSVLPEGQFVFTYDDGPDATYTRQIRDIWAQAEMAKPSFFWLGSQIATKTDIVKELNDQGYTISSHSHGHTVDAHSELHADLGNLAKAASFADFNAVNKSLYGTDIEKMSPEEFATWKIQTLDQEINEAVGDLSKILGKPVRYFRLPYGSGLRNELIGERFQALNLENFFWRVDSLDWQDKNPESIRDRVVGQMKTVKSGIILFHDVHPQSVEAAKLMVEFLKATPDWKAVPLESIPGLNPSTH